MSVEPEQLNNFIEEGKNAIALNNLLNFVEILDRVTENRHRFLIECGHFACSLGHLPAVIFVLEFIDLATFDGRITWFMYHAAKNGQTKTLAFLINKYPANVSVHVLSVTKTDECLQFLVNRGCVRPSDLEYLLKMDDHQQVFELIQKLHKMGIALPDTVCGICSQNKNWMCLEYALEKGKKWDNVKSADLKAYKQWIISQCSL
jgi:hypothetical protein